MQLFLLSKYQFIDENCCFSIITILYQYFETLIKIYCVFMFLFFIHIIIIINNNNNNNSRRASLFKDFNFFYV